MKFVDCSDVAMNTITKENYETFFVIFEKYQNLYHKLSKLKFNNNDTTKKLAENILSNLYIAEKKFRNKLYSAQPIMDDSDWPGWSIVVKYKGKIGYPNNLRFDQLADQAKPYWKKKAWDYAKLDQYPDQSLAEKIFQISVNMGKFWAIAFLQRSFNVLNRLASYYFDLKVDGVAGSMILSAVLAYSAHEGNNKNLLTAVTGLQIARYIALGEANEKLEDFENG